MVISKTISAAIAHGTEAIKMISIAIIYVLINFLVSPGVDAIYMEEGGVMTKCEKAMTLTFNTVWANSALEQLKANRNEINKTWVINVALECSDAIERLDPGCVHARRAIGMAHDLWMTGLNPLVRGIMHVYVNVDQSKVPKPNIFVGFYDNNGEHMMRHRSDNCAFGSTTLAHANGYFIHFNLAHNMLKERITRVTQMFYQTMAHEYGHVMGISHEEERESLMYPFSNRGQFPFSRIDEAAIQDAFKEAEKEATDRYNDWRRQSEEIDVFWYEKNLCEKNKNLYDALPSRLFNRGRPLERKSLEVYLQRKRPTPVPPPTTTSTTTTSTTTTVAPPVSTTKTSTTTPPPAPTPPIVLDVKRLKNEVMYDVLGALNDAVRNYIYINRVRRGDRFSK